MKEKGGKEETGKTLCHFLWGIYFTKKENYFRNENTQCIMYAYLNVIMYVYLNVSLFTQYPPLHVH